MKDNSELIARLTTDFLENFQKDLVLFTTAIHLDARRQAADLRSKMHEALDAYVDHYAKLNKTEE